MVDELDYVMPNVVREILLRQGISKVLLRELPGRLEFIVRHG
jgi:hypothetical protein